jgi:hypothetical protein
MPQFAIVELPALLHPQVEMRFFCPFDILKCGPITGPPFLECINGQIDNGTQVLRHPKQC